LRKLSLVRVVGLGAPLLLLLLGLSVLGSLVTVPLVTALLLVTVSGFHWAVVGVVLLTVISHSFLTTLLLLTLLLTSLLAVTLLSLSLLLLSVALLAVLTLLLLPVALLTVLSLGLAVALLLAGLLLSLLLAVSLLLLAVTLVVTVTAVPLLLGTVLALLLVGVVALLLLVVATVPLLLLVVTTLRSVSTVSGVVSLLVALVGSVTSVTTLGLAVTTLVLWFWSVFYALGLNPLVFDLMVMFGDRLAYTLLVAKGDETETFVRAAGIVLVWHQVDLSNRSISGEVALNVFFGCFHGEASNKNFVALTLGCSVTSRLSGGLFGSGCALLGINPLVVKGVRAVLQDAVNAGGVGVGDKTETPGVSGLFVHHEDAVLDVAVLGKVHPQAVLCGFSGNSSNKHLSSFIISSSHDFCCVILLVKKLNGICVAPKGL